MGQSRKYLWDNYKFFLIFCVVLGHMAGYWLKDDSNVRVLFFAIYTFHMPAFLFVSGLFSKTIIAKKRWDKAAEYLVIYFFMKIIIYFTRKINGGNPKFNIFFADGVEWYAFAMAVFIVITFFIVRFKPVYVLIICVIIGCLAGYYAFDGDFLVNRRILVFYPFFYMGYLLNPDKIEAFTRKKVMRIGALISCLILSVFLWKNIERLYRFRPFLTGRNPHSQLGNLELYGGLLRAGYYVVVLGLILLSIALIPSIYGMISRWGSSTLAVYVFHRPLIYFIYGCLEGKILISAFSSGVRCLVLAALSLLIVLLFVQPFWSKIVQYLLYPVQSLGKRIRSRQ